MVVAECVCLNETHFADMMGSFVTALLKHLGAVLSHSYYVNIEAHMFRCLMFLFIMSSCFQLYLYVCACMYACMYVFVF